MNYSEALSYLEEVRENGTKLSLSNIKKIIENLPFSLSKIKFIQVAGTNGKGSTSHFITSILKSEGFKVGLFTSPHLQNIRERITINKNWISEQEFADQIEKIKAFVKKLKKEKVIETIPTFFEHLLLLSLFYFFYKSTDYAVLEVGLGGRLDATTAIKPIVSIITNISLEHTKTLGKHIKDIAFEKAGISKPHVPLVCGCNKYSISTRVIKAVCENKQAYFHQVFNKHNFLTSEMEEGFYNCSYKTPKDTYNYKVYMNGLHQTRNAATAIKAIEVINDSDNTISMESIKQGIKENFVPGRIELIKGIPDIIIDGGHNVDGINALANHLKSKNYKNCTLIFGVLRDKKYRKMVELLKPYIKNIILVKPKSNRALPLTVLKSLFSDKKTYIFDDDYIKGMAFAKEINETIIITGSIYMIGEMRNILFPLGTAG